MAESIADQYDDDDEYGFCSQIMRIVGGQESW